VIRQVIRKDYESIVLPYPDIRFQNREAPAYHQFKTVTDEQPIVLFRRIKPNPQEGHLP